MKKLILTLLFGMIGFILQAQEQLTFENPVLRVENVQYTLTNVDDWGIATILVEVFDNKGNVHQTGNLVDGKKSGVWRMFDSNGILLSEMRFANDNRNWQRVYTLNGFTHIVYQENRPAKVETHHFLVAVN